MYCSNCGREIPEGSAFCINCGAKVEDAPLDDQTGGQQPYVQQAYGQQPYSQQPYGQPPKKGKPKAWLFIAGGAVLLLAIAAVLIFVVFGGGGWPLSGNTTQTKFVNDAVKVFTGAFSDLSPVDTNRMMSEPFDVEMEMTAESGGTSQDATVAIVYDKQKLGLSAESDYSTVVLLLDGDTIYASEGEYVSGLQFDTDTDLDRDMTLRDRITALFENASDYDIDYQKLVEMLLNSVNEDCFKKSGDTITLTLTMDDIVDTLKVFSDKLEEDEELSDQLSDMIKDFGGGSMDASTVVDAAASMLEANLGSYDLELTWEIRYDGSTPVGMTISSDDGTESGSFEVNFEYENTKGGKDISFSAKSAVTEVTGELSVTTSGGETELDGSYEISYDGTVYVSYEFQGSVKVAGEDVSGSIEVTDTAYGSTSSIDYNGTIAFGMPEDRVEEDNRFEMDTSGATVTDLSDIVGSGYSAYSFGD